MIRGYCRSGVIAFIYLEECFNSAVLRLLSNLCEVRSEKRFWECLLSGVKISRDLPYSISSGCTYFEVSQGYYIGLLPGYIDIQCIYCHGELRCRYGLQKKVCSEFGVKEATSHVDIEYVKELILKLRDIEGNFIWCITKDGKLVFEHL